MLLRASSVLRRQLCPGSAAMENGLPEEDSEIAAEGTLLHRLDADPTLPRDGLNARQKDLLGISARLTKEAFERIGAQFGVSDVMPTASGYEREMFLHRGIKCLYSGHCDVWEYFAEQRLLVLLEKKFGYLSVDPASSNMQTRTYACMGAEAHDCEHVAVIITQPRLPIDDRLTLAVYNGADISAARHQLFEIWEACHTEGAPLKPSDQACRYCLAKKVCPAFRETIVSSVAIVPSVQGLTPAARESKIEERIKQASDAELAKLYDAVHLAGFVKDPLFDEIRDRIRAGGMEGYRLGKETEIREITDTVQAIGILSRDGFDVVEVERRAISKFSVGAVEELIRERDGGTWQDPRDKVNTLLSDVIDRKPKKPSIEKVKALPA